jgi:hypothetical protein
MPVAVATMVVGAVSAPALSCKVAVFVAVGAPSQTGPTVTLLVSPEVLDPVATVVAATMVVLAGKDVPADWIVTVGVEVTEIVDCEQDIVMYPYHTRLMGMVRIVEPVVVAEPARMFAVFGTPGEVARLFT